MSLPFRAAIAAVRERWRRATRAEMDLETVRNALQAVRIVERQTMLQPEASEADVPELPDLTGWDVEEDAVDVAAPLHERLASRRRVLEAARDLLEPVAAEAPGLAAELARLQHQQQHALSDPTWSEQVEQIRDLAEQRDALLASLSPLRGRLAMVEPARDTLGDLVDKLGQVEDDPTGIASWRMASIAAAGLAGLEVVLDTVGLPARLPAPPKLPPGPDPVHPDALWDDVARIRAALGELQAILSEEGSVLEQEAQQVESRYEAVRTRIEELLG